ncbi:hypothetical protein [[Eubacterium] cellulosolvens]
MVIGMELSCTKNGWEVNTPPIVPRRQTPVVLMLSELRQFTT